MALLRFPRRSKPRNRFAFVFYATEENYAIAVLVFVHLLRGLGMRQDADVLVLHLPLAAEILDKMKRVGIATRRVKPFRHVMNGHYRHSFLKLRIFELVEYDRLIFADADAIPLKSLDYLLSLASAAPIAAARAYWLAQPRWTSALLVVQPSLAQWNRTRPHIETARQTGFYDMDILNHEFAQEIESLPPAAFCLNTEWEDANRPGHFPDPVQAYATVSVVHFTALGKPWSCSTSEARRLRPNAHPLFFDLWEKWWMARDEIFP